MPHNREVAVTAFSIALSVSACAFQTQTNPSSTIPKDVVQPTGLAGQAQQEDKRLSAGDSDSDCALTTGDIHLWCKWISRYY